MAQICVVCIKPLVDKRYRTISSLKAMHTLIKEILHIKKSTCLVHCNSRICDKCFNKLNRIMRLDYQISRHEELKRKRVELVALMQSYSREPVEAGCNERVEPTPNSESGLRYMYSPIRSTAKFTTDNADKSSVSTLATSEAPKSGQRKMESRTTKTTKLQKIAPALPALPLMLLQVFPAPSSACLEARCDSVQKHAGIATMPTDVIPDDSTGVENSHPDIPCSAETVASSQDSAEEQAAGIIMECTCEDDDSMAGSEMEKALPAAKEEKHIEDLPSWTKWQDETGEGPPAVIGTGNLTLSAQAGLMYSASEHAAISYVKTEPESTVSWQNGTNSLSEKNVNYVKEEPADLSVDWAKILSLAAFSAQPARVGHSSCVSTSNSMSDMPIPDLLRDVDQIIHKSKMLGESIESASNSPGQSTAQTQSTVPTRGNSTDQTVSGWQPTKTQKPNSSL